MIDGACCIYLLSMLASCPFGMCREGGIGEQECSIWSPRMIFPQLQYIRRSNKKETMSKSHECSRKHDSCLYVSSYQGKRKNSCQSLSSVFDFAGTTQYKYRASIFLILICCLSMFFDIIYKTPKTSKARSTRTNLVPDRTYHQFNISYVHVQYVPLSIFCNIYSVLVLFHLHFHILFHFHLLYSPFSSSPPPLKLAH